MQYFVIYFNKTIDYPVISSTMGELIQLIFSVSIRTIDDEHVRLTYRWGKNRPVLRCSRTNIALYNLAP